MKKSGKKSRVLGLESGVPASARPHAKGRDDSRLKTPDSRLPSVRCAFTRLADVAALKPNPRNPNQHPEEQLRIFWKIVQHQGIRRPAVVSIESGLLVTGHGLVACLQLGGVKQCPVDEQHFPGSKPGRPGPDETAHLLADNSLPQLAELNEGEVKLLLTDLQIAEVDLELAGFDEEALRGLDLIPPAEIKDAPPQVDRAAALQKQWKTKLGQLWELGEHRLLCGDCRDAKAVTGLFKQHKINLAFTSPPYASQRKYDESSDFKPIPPSEYVEWFKPIAESIANLLTPDGSFFCNIKEHCQDGQRSLYVKKLVIAHVEEWGWLWIDEFCWKRNGVPGGWTNRFPNSWEPIFQFARSRKQKVFRENVLQPYAPSSITRLKTAQKKGPKGREISGTESGFSRDWQTCIASAKKGGAIPDNFIELSQETSNVGHPAAFPVGLPAFFIKAFSEESDSIYDPFLGSGSTLIACENLQRRCFALEISPAYVAVALQRFQDATGKKPKLV